MGAVFEIDSINYRVKVLPTRMLTGTVIDVNSCIDAVPILAVLGCYAEGETTIVNGAIARKKECNRLACITSELKKMNGSIEETEDGLKIKRSQLVGASVFSYADHRIAMSLIIAGLGAEGETVVDDVACINKSYPSFLHDLKKGGAFLWEQS